MPKELEEAPECPAGFEYLWEWFQRLNACRPPGMSGVSGIPETEIRAYFKNRGIWPEPWELRVLERLDNVAMQSGDKEQNGDDSDEG